MSYHDTLIHLCNMLPDYCMEFFNAKADSKQIRTRVAYAGDLKVFFEYILTRKDLGAFDSIENIPLTIFDRLKNTDINAYLAYLEEYEFEGKKYTNSAAGKKRKLACLKTFCKYFRMVGKLNSNPTELVELPSVKEKEILILTENEQKQLLDQAESGNRKTDRQKKYHDKTKYRDMAILTLFLNTGIRVSELVNIDDYDLDLSEQRVLITRKGGKQEFVYFNNETLAAITDYLDLERNELLCIDKEFISTNEIPNGPLFVSLKHDRISVRMVQYIVKNYATAVLPPGIKVTPHILRKTFGTSLYQKYRDLYLVQHALGHESPQTTSKHYTKYNPEYNKQLKQY